MKKVGPKRRRRIARIARFFADHPSLNADRWIGAGAAYPRGHLPWADPKVAVSAFAQRLYIAAAVQGVPRGQGGSGHQRPRWPSHQRPRASHQQRAGGPPTKGQRRSAAPRPRGSAPPKTKAVRPTKGQGGRRTEAKGVCPIKNQGWAARASSCASREPATPKARH